MSSDVGVAQTPNALPSERRSRLVGLLETQGLTANADLALHLGVSYQTVLRDLGALQLSGKIRRVRGGAAPTEPDIDRWENRGHPPSEAVVRSDELGVISQLLSRTVVLTDRALSCLESGNLPTALHATSAARTCADLARRHVNGEL